MAKYEKYLKNERWYHATTLEGWKHLCDKKIDVQYNKGNELDFGYGFYLTPSQQHAEAFIRKIIELKLKQKQVDYSEIEGLEEITGISQPVSGKDDLIPVVIEFVFCPYGYYNSEWEFQIYDKYDDAFAEFVFHNRIKNVAGEAQHGNDLIFGVMSDSIPTQLIANYKNGDVTYEDVIEGLKKTTSSKQLSIHNQGICDTIKVNRVYLVETKEELNANDYNG